MKVLRVLFCLLLPLSMPGQNDLSIEFLTEKNGLSYRQVNSVYQDSLGFMWFATADGLNRYDGVEWVIYKHSDKDPASLPDNNILWVMEESAGNLLIGSKGRIVLFDRQTLQFRATRWLDNDKVVDFLAFQPFKTPEGDYFTIANQVQTQKKYLLKYLGNGLFGQAVHLDGFSEGVVFDDNSYPIVFIGGKSNRYWYQFAGWFFCFQMTDLTISGHPLVFQFKEGKCRFIAEPSEHGALFDSFDLPASIPIADWRDCLMDNYWNIWIREKNGRLFKYDVHRKQLEETGKADFNQISISHKIFEDKEGTLWIPHKFGVVKIKKRRNYFENFLNVPQAQIGQQGLGKEVYAMVEDKFGRVIVAAADGFYRVFPKAKKAMFFDWVYADGLSMEEHMWGKDSYEIKAIVDSAGMIWYNKGYLFKCDPENDRCTVFDYGKERGAGINFMVTLKQDNFGKFWLSRGTLFSFDPATGKFNLPPALQQKEFQRAMCADGDFMWANTKTGLMRFHAQNQSFTYYDLFPENANEILSILPYKGDLWMASRHGLLRYNPQNQELRTYTAADGLSHETVYTLLLHEDNLWLGTHFGLCRFNIKSEAVRNYYVEDGLTYNEFNREAAVKTRDGKMYFGGINGINAFYPAVLDSLSKAESANLVFTGFSKIDGKSDTILHYGQVRLQASKVIELMHRDRSFTFRYALLSFSDPSENKYYHLLEGVDENWVYTRNEGYVNYPNLAPGKYVLRVKAIDSRGNYGNNELVIPVVVYGPWWNRWWAYCIFAAILIVLIFWARQYEMRRLWVAADAKRVKELDSLKTKLYTNITHEFRTPLTVIMGIAENMPGAEEDRRLILRNSKKLLHLVNQMLDLSKLESGAMQLNLHQADIFKYLRYLTESFYSTAKERDIRLVFYAEEPSLVMDFDEEKLQHVIYNLLSNALKFTARGGKVVLHAKKNDTAQTRELQLNVQDTGMGIAEENLPHVFDRFYQVKDTTLSYVEGTGIGLALTKEFVELMGGRISVASILGEGSTFTVWLPIKNEAPLLTLEERPISVEDLVVSKAGIQEEGINVTQARLDKNLSSNKPLLLIVEDNKDVAAYIKSIVKDDYEVINAFNGQAGVTMAIELVPDIIISDVMMPIMDGYELTQTLKSDARTSHIPIIMLTAKAEQQDRLAGLRLGADAYLVKPFNKAELLVRLEKLTELRRVLQQRYAGLDESLISNSAATIEDDFLKNLIQIVRANLDDPEFSTPGLCREAHLSQPQLYRKLMALTGKSPVLFIRTIRLRKAADLLKTTHENISEIAWATGFKDPNYFSRAFKEEFGKTPGEWRG